MKVSEENKHLKKKIDYQSTIVKEQVSQYQNIDDEIINDRRNFELKEEQNKGTHDEFTTKIKNLEKKIYEYQYLTVYKDNENDIVSKKQNIEKDEFEKLQMKLLDIEHQNEFLLGKLNEAEKQINHLEALQVPLTLKQKLEIYKNKKENKKKST